MINRDIASLEPKFREKVVLWLDRNPNIFVTESKRSYMRQLLLYAQGRTRMGKIVTWTLKSHHTLGTAVDIAFEGKELYPKDWAKWRKVADSAKKYNIDWGFDLWQIDKPHFQDNGQPLNPLLMPLPIWPDKEPQRTVTEMKAAGITTDPTLPVGEIPTYQLFLMIKKYTKYLNKQ